MITIGGQPPRENLPAHFRRGNIQMIERHYKILEWKVNLGNKIN